MPKMQRADKNVGEAEPKSIFEDFMMIYNYIM